MTASGMLNASVQRLFALHVEKNAFEVSNIIMAMLIVNYILH